MIRASRSDPCRVCGGWPGLPRGKGERCTGYLSEDGKYVHCTREESAGTLQPDSANPPTYAHLDSEECNCGHRHQSYGMAPKPLPAVRRKLISRTTWDIRDVDGGFVGTHVRNEYDSGPKDYKWEPLGLNPGTMIYGAELLKGNTLPVIVTEGEKACDALRTLNLNGAVVVAIVTGAPGPPLAPSALALFHGRRVYPWADNDDVGRKQMDQFAADLTDLADVRPIRWGEQDKDDAADWLERGGNRAGLAALVRSASDDGKVLQLPGVVPQLLESDVPEVKRAGLGYLGVWARQGIRLQLNRVHTRRDDVGGLLEVVRGDRPLYFGSFHAGSLSNREQITKYLRSNTGGYEGWQAILEAFSRHVLHLHTDGEPIEELDAAAPPDRRPPLVAPWLPHGVPTTIFGPGEAGKTSVAAAVAVAVLTGYPILDWEPRVGRVLVLDWEADRGAWDSRIGGIARAVDQAPPRYLYRRCSTPLADDVERIAEVVVAREVQLVIVDSMTGACGPRDTGEDVHGPVNRLHDALRLIGSTSLIVDHVTKDEANGNGKSGQSHATPTGSVMKINRVRSAWEVRGETEPVLPGGEREITMRHAKVNDGPRLDAMLIGITWSEDQATCSLRKLTTVTAPELAAHAGSLTDRIASELRGGILRTSEIASALSVGESTIRMTMIRHKERFIPVSRGTWALVYQGEAG